MGDSEGAMAETGGIASLRRTLGTTLLVLCGACLIAGAIGFGRTSRTYRSTALVARVPQAGMAAGSVGGNAALWAADAKLAGSRAVVDRAMVSPDWPAEWPLGPEAGVSLAKGLSADVQPGGALRLAYDDPDPAVAQVRLAAFVDAYRGLIRQSESVANVIRVKLLTEALEEERDERERQAIESKIARYTAPIPEPTRVVAPAGPARLVPARHWRDAGWGAAIAGAVVIVVRGPRVWRAWRTARVIAAGRRAFPVVVGAVTPRPVVSVGGENNGDGAAAGDG